jgi:hypothetical protein
MRRSLNFLMYIRGALNPDKSSIFNVRFNIQIPRYPSIRPPMSARGDDGISKCQRGLLRPREGTCSIYIDDVRHILNVVSLPCRIRVDNPWRLAIQCEFLTPFIPECVL